MRGARGSEHRQRDYQVDAADVADQDAGNHPRCAGSRERKGDPSHDVLEGRDSGFVEQQPQDQPADHFALTGSRKPAVFSRQTAS